MISQATRELGADEVAAALARAFEHPLLRPEEPDPFERLLQSFFEALSGLDVDPAVGWALLWISALSLIVLLVWGLARLRGTFARRVAASAAADPAAQAARLQARLAELEARARVARAVGDWSLALRLSFFALLIALSRRGDLELREAWTHREMLERGSPSARARAALEPWLPELDRKLFGAHGATAADLAWFDGLRERLLARDGGGGA